MLPLQWGVVVGASLVGAFSDLRVRRVPNALTVPVLLGGLIWASWIGGLGGLVDATAGCLLLALPYVLLFMFAGGGAGDAKLMGALGAWLGVSNGVVVLVAVVLAGAVLAVGFTLARKQLGAMLANLARMVSIVIFLPFVRGRVSETCALLPRSQEMGTIPYGLAIAGGVCIAAGGLFVWRA